MNGRIRALTTLASASVLMLGMMGGVDAAAPDKVGGASGPVSLRLGSPYSCCDPRVDLFADQVRQLSGDQLAVDVVWAAAGDIDEPESATVAMVRDGTLDLALVWARAFDTQGITEFEALQAPFLITDAAFLKKVVTSPIAADMLQGLADAGLVGLELLPGTPRYPVGLDHPFLALEDFAGARIKVPESKVSDEILRALGAIPVHLRNSAYDAAVDAGELDGRLDPMRSDLLRPGSILTSNIVFYAVPDALVASRSTFDALSAEQQAVIRSAAANTLEHDLGAVPDTDDTQGWCAIGSIVVAATDDVAAIVEATRPVYAALEGDARTNGYIDRIEALKKDTAIPAAAPASCETESTPTAAPGTATIPDGTYTTIVTKQDALRSTFSQADSCTLQSDGTTHETLIIAGGRFTFLLGCQGMPEEVGDTGRYTTTADRLVMTSTCCPEEPNTLAWSLIADTLTLRTIDQPDTTEDLAAAWHFLFDHDWTRVD